MARVGFDPTPGQLPILFATDENGTDFRFIMVGGGERGGKSQVAEMYLFTRHMWGGERWDGEDELLFWIIGPDYEQTRNEAEYLIKHLYQINNVDGDPSTPLNGSWTIKTRFPAGTIVTKSSKDPETIAGKAPHGILAVEIGQQTYEAYLRCMGRVAETRGWAFFSGTFENSTDWYADQWHAWQGENPEGGRSFSLPTHSNTKIFPEGENDPEILRLKRTFPPDKFSERFLGIPVKPAGLVYKEASRAVHARLFRLGGIPELDREILIDPERYGVRLWIDPGHEGYWVGWGMVVGDTAYVLDEVFTTGMISEDVIDICQNRPLWKYVNRLVMDIAGKQHHGSKAPKEIWEEATGMSVYTRKYAVPDEIMRVRSSLRVDPLTGQPHLLISSWCKRLWEEMTKLYKYPTDETGMATSNIPIPKDNHACTGLAYGLLDAFGYVKSTKKRGYIGRESSIFD